VLSQLHMRDLRCQGLLNPLGICDAQPRLSWRCESPLRSTSVSAYQVIVASTAALLRSDTGDLWDTGRVEQTSDVDIAYAGTSLISLRRAHWKVRVWDSNGAASDWSGPAWWEAAPVAGAAWDARWIEAPWPVPVGADMFTTDDPLPLFRKGFVLEKAVQSARLLVTGLGWYEATINGEPIDDARLDPPWTDYRKRVLYRVHDVTNFLSKGTNAIALTAAHGWYNPLPLKMWGWLNVRDHLLVGRPRVIAQLHVTLDDGSEQTIVTDESWRVAPGPIVRSSVYLGEVFDARRCVPRWNFAGFDDAKWDRAVVSSQPVGPLEAATIPPIREVERIEAARITMPQPGVFIADFGQNLSGVVSIASAVPEQTRVELRFGELLYDDGTLNGRTSVCGQIKAPLDNDAGTAWQQDAFIHAGPDDEPAESMQPRFTWHGFRYARITGLPEGATLSEHQVIAHRLQTDIADAGDFACSDETLTSVQKMVQRTFRANLLGVQSDCPHRERFGYGGDIAATAVAYSLNLDARAIHEKSAMDLVDAQRDNGALTETAPYVGIDAPDFTGSGAGPVGWGLALPMLMVTLRQYHGDTRSAQRLLEPALKWVEFLKSRAVDHLIPDEIGDHESLAKRDALYTGSVHYFSTLRMIASAAGWVGRNEQARELEEHAEVVRSAILRKFFDPSTGRLAQGTQFQQAAALRLGIVPENARQTVLGVLLDSLQQAGDKLTTGIFGTRYVLAALAEARMTELAYRVLTAGEFPGFAHMLERGATTLWEHWQFSDDTYSHNHPMFGSVSEFFFTALAGIVVAADAVGADRLVIRPQPVTALSWVRAHWDGPRGRVAVSWKRTGSAMKLDVTVPTGCIAVVHVPTSDASSVSESGRSVQVSKDVRTVLPGVYRVGGGAYQFTARA
jgi:alpha-L-rhamnosidase